MQCREVREMADSYLSEELLVETNHEILRHLAQCPECQTDLAARRALRESVRRAFANANNLGPRPEFLATLRTRLQEVALNTPRRGTFVVRGWWALAATVVLAVLLTVVFGRRASVTPPGRLAQLAVGDHRNCALHFRLAEQPISLEEAAKQYDSAYRVLQEFPPDGLMTAAGPAHVLERHSCVYAGRRFAHIVLRYQGVVVSLLATKGDGSPQIALPREAVPDLTSEGRIDDVSVVSFRADPFMVFIAGDLEQADLLRLANVAAGPLRERLSGRHAILRPTEPLRSAITVAGGKKHPTAVKPPLAQVDIHDAIPPGWESQ